VGVGEIIGVAAGVDDGEADGELIGVASGGGREVERSSLVETTTVRAPETTISSNKTRSVCNFRYFTAVPYGYSPVDLPYELFRAHYIPNWVLKQ